MDTLTTILHGLGFLLAALFFCLMSWVSLKFFTVDNPGSKKGKRLISALAGGNAVIVLWTIAGMTPSHSLPGTSALAAANVLYLYAICMFFWAWRANQAAPLDFIGSSKPPGHLNRDGPYAVVRHPFYSAYCASWIASCFATHGQYAVATLGLVLIVVYVSGARQEERLFAQGQYGPTYRKYSQDVPMLIPNLSVRRSRL